MKGLDFLDRSNILLKWGGVNFCIDMQHLHDFIPRQYILEDTHHDNAALAPVLRIMNNSYFICIECLIV